MRTHTGLLQGERRRRDEPPPAGWLGDWANGKLQLLRREVDRLLRDQGLHPGHVARQ